MPILREVPLTKGVKAAKGSQSLRGCLDQYGKADGQPAFGKGEYFKVGQISPSLDSRFRGNDGLAPLFGQAAFLLVKRPLAFATELSTNLEFSTSDDATRMWRQLIRFPRRNHSLETVDMENYEKLGAFYLGQALRSEEPETQRGPPALRLQGSRDACGLCRDDGQRQNRPLPQLAGRSSHRQYSSSGHRSQG